MRAPRDRIRPVALVGVLAVVGCTRAEDAAPLTTSVATAPPATAPPITAPPVTAPPVTAPPATAPPASTAAPSTPAATTAVRSPPTVPASTVPASTALQSGSTPYVVPVADVAAAGWADEHHDYPATDVFVGCGAGIVSPVNGVLLEVRRVNAYEPAVDNPATRGGRSISILGDDGVRYYLAHFESIDEGWEPGGQVAAGARLGTMGQTGRAGACHLHVAISPPCPGREWSVRRGVVWPYPYLDSWRDGDQRSPVDEVAAWTASHPAACADAMADPYAADA